MEQKLMFNLISVLPFHFKGGDSVSQLVVLSDRNLSCLLQNGRYIMQPKLDKPQHKILGTRSFTVYILHSWI